MLILITFCILLLLLLPTSIISYSFGFDEGKRNGYRSGYIDACTESNRAAVALGYGYWHLDNTTGETRFNWTQHNEINQRIESVTKCGTK